MRLNAYHYLELFDVIMFCGAWGNASQFEIVHLHRN